MLDLTQACPTLEPVRLAGREFLFRQLRLFEWAEVQAWLKTQAPNPIALAARGLAELRADGVTVPADVQKMLFEQAQEESRRWPPRVGSASWLRSLDELAGGRARFLLAALKPSGETLAEDEAGRIVEDAGDEEMAELVRVTLWGDHTAPKSTTHSAKDRIIQGMTATSGAPSSSESTN